MTGQIVKSFKVLKKKKSNITLISALKLNYFMEIGTPNSHVQQ